MKGLAQAVSLSVLAWLVAGCGSVPFDVTQVDPSMSCVAWRSMSDDARLAVADRLVGRSADVLEAVRVAQHEPPGTPRAKLVREVADSLTKNCDVMAPAWPNVVDLFRRLYPPVS